MVLERERDCESRGDQGRAEEGGRRGYTKTEELCLKGNCILRYYLALFLRAHCTFVSSNASSTPKQQNPYILMANI